MPLDIADAGVFAALVGVSMACVELAKHAITLRGKDKAPAINGNGTKATLGEILKEVHEVNQYHHECRADNKRRLDILTYQDADGRLRIYTPQGLEPAIKELASATKDVVTFLRAHDERTGIAIKKIDDIHDYIKDAGRKNANK